MLRLVLLFISAYCVLARNNPQSSRSQIRVRRDVEPYVINGVNAVKNEFPFLLSVHFLSKTKGTFSHGCGASLLTATTALTAAHCVNSTPAADIKVYAGVYKLSDLSGAVVSDVSDYIEHEGYEILSSGINNDVAIMYLTTPIYETATIKYAKLPANILANTLYKTLHKTCTIAGWGRFSASQDLPDTMQKAQMRAITNPECQLQMNSYDVTVGNDQICLDDPKAAACQGDSGGPLICTTLFGVVTVNGVCSWGISEDGVCVVTMPSVYADTAHHLNWIKKHGYLSPA